VITFARAHSFDHAVKRLPLDRKRRIHDAVEALIKGLNAEPQVLPPGLGFKRLRANFHEIRAGLADRVIVKWTGHHLQFVLAGSHDEVRRFLRTL